MPKHHTANACLHSCTGEYIAAAAMRSCSYLLLFAAVHCAAAMQRVSVGGTKGGIVTKGGPGEYGGEPDWGMQDDADSRALRMACQ
jgi:hypothetical protein